jgi:hypothetical protein
VQGVSPVPNLCNVNVGQLITEEPVCVCGGGGCSCCHARRVRQSRQLLPESHLLAS